MLTATSVDWQAVTDFVRATDPHAAHHVAWLEQTRRAVLGEESVSAAQGCDLAERLERWRYQHLHQRGAELSAQDNGLLDALDVSANQLAGRPSRPPRATRWAIQDPTLESGSVQEAVSLLDALVPLDHVIGRATELTREHFSWPAEGGAAGTSQRRMLLYAPVYVSSECVNFCTYCGFRFPQPIVRKHLTRAQVVEQARILMGRGFRQQLLVGGEFPSHTTPAYYAELLEALVQEGIVPSVEIAPQTTASYAQLAAAGAYGVTLYQETYDQQLYPRYHVRGPKAAYHWRLEAHDRAAEAGVARLGFGFLLGLAEAQAEMRAMLRHAAYLQQRFPDRTLAFSLPRIREAPDEFAIPFPVGDDDLVRFYGALRVAFPRAELVLSTRESPPLRNRLAGICITQMSAGSSTAPGGYGETAEKVGEQFPVVDQRSPAEVAQWLAAHGFHVAWTLPRATDRVT